VAILFPSEVENLQELHTEFDSAQQAILAELGDQTLPAGKVMSDVAHNEKLDEGVVQKALWELVYRRLVELTGDYMIRALA
jgi:energy-converting hydrogenase A subunit M